MNTSTLIQVKAMRLVVVAGIAIMGVKFTAFFITRSNAILTDALESVINVVAGLFAYYSLHLAAKPKDHNHPYGHGKIEFVSAGFEGGLVLIAGIIIIVKSIVDFFHPSAVEQLSLGTCLAAITGLFNYLLGRYLIKTGTHHHSIALVADGKHLKSDTYSSIGLVAGLLLISLTQLFWLDNVLAIAFGLVIIFTGYKLVRRSLAGLMDEADETILKQVIAILNASRKPEWIDIHNLRIQQYGSSFHIDCHITLPWYNDLRISHHELKNIEGLILQKFHNRVELFIHPDPCVPLSCNICQLVHCKVRQKPFEHIINWEMENLLKNEKHRSDPGRVIISR